MEAYGSKPYTIIERDGIRMGIFGMIDGILRPVHHFVHWFFDDTIETAKRVVKGLKAENVDIIVCISHQRYCK